MRCSRRECSRDGRYRPVLLIRAREGTRPTLIELKIEHCASCAKPLSLDDVMSDTTWYAILRDFFLRGDTLPDRKLTELAWSPRESWRL